MGQNKALMLFHGIPLIQRVARRVALTASDINLIANEDNLYSFLNYPIYADVIPDKGVLGGIYSAFLHSKTPFMAPVACDSPFISPGLLSAELKILMESDLDLVVPESANGLEPLHAVYRCKSCLPGVEKSIRDGSFRIVSWFDEVQVKVLSPAEVTQIDPDPYIFLNLNRPEEFKQAMEIMEDDCVDE